jgi:hypothetical protein
MGPEKTAATGRRVWRQIGWCVIGVAAIPPLLAFGAVEKIFRLICQKKGAPCDLTGMHPPHTPSLAAGYCGVCHEPVRLGETCCDEPVGWIAPDGLAFNDYREYAVAIAAGRMLDARLDGSIVEDDDVLTMDPDLFLSAWRSAEVSDIVRRAYTEGWPDWMLARAIKAVKHRPY